MSEPIRSIKDTITVPKDLVEAVKKGERLESKPRRRQRDTTGTHIRRFSLAIVGYACAAAVIIGNLYFIPPLLKDDPAPDGALTQPSITVPPADELPDAYQRSDLLWATELNGLYEHVLYRLWSDQGELSSALSLVASADTVYAVKGYTRSETEMTAGSQAEGLELLDGIVEYLAEEEGWERFEGADGSDLFAVTKAQLDALDEEALFEALDECGVLDATNALGEQVKRDAEFRLELAWQSTDGSPEPDKSWQSILSGYAPVPEDTLYLRPELVWANELNPDHRDLVLFMARRTEGKIYRLMQMNDLMQRFAVAIDIDLPDTEMSEEERALIKAYLAPALARAQGWAVIEGYGGDAGEVYAVTSAQIALLTGEFLVELADELLGENELTAEWVGCDIGISVVIAWQSLSDAVRWDADNFEQESTHDEEYFVHTDNDHPIDTDMPKMYADSSTLPERTENSGMPDIDRLYLTGSEGVQTDEMITVIAKKVSSRSTYGKYGSDYTPLAMTWSTLEIVEMIGEPSEAFAKQWGVWEGGEITLLESYAILPTDEGDAIYYSNFFPYRYDRPGLLEEGEEYLMVLASCKGMGIDRISCYGTEDDTLYVATATNDYFLATGDIYPTDGGFYENFTAGSASDLCMPEQGSALYDAWAANYPKVYDRFVK